MTVFYIDTTSKYLYTGIVRDNKLIASIKKDLGKNLSVYAVSEVSKMFDEANIKPSFIDKIIVVNGPGSFTGIRIGVTIAKIFAWSLNIPITTVTSLEAMVESVDTDKLIVPIINARHDSCYAAIYDNGRVIQEGKYMPIEVLKMFLIGLNREYIFVSGDSFPFAVKNYDPNILKIVEKYQDRKNINPHLINPLYLKLTEAEENRLKNND